MESDKVFLIIELNFLNVNPSIGRKMNEIRK